MIRENESELLQLLVRTDTPTLANAIERLNVRPRTEGFSHKELRALFPDLGVMCGYAVTAEAQTMTDETGDRDENVARYLELCQAIADAPKPCVVIMQEKAPDGQFAAHCGEILCSLFHRFGACGFVSDCATRDLPEVRALGFHLFATGTVASHANFRVMRIGTPVDICGLRIAPGDLLHGDINGLISIPPEKRDQLPREIQAVRSAERRVMDYLKEECVDFDELAKRMMH